MGIKIVRWDSEFWREYNRNYYRTVMNPYFYLQFFKRLLQQQKISKWCRKGHIIPSRCSRCPICHREKQLEYQKRKSGKISKSLLRSREIRATYRENRAWVLKELGNRCKKCGFDNPLALDIHHKIQEQKPKKWADNKKQLFYSWRKKGAIPQDELENMILLCSNCHRILHGELAKI